MKQLLAVVAILATQNMTCRYYFTDLQQLQGTWRVRQQNGGLLYETWNKTGERQMTGKSYKLRGADTVLLEEVLLEADKDGIFYWPLVTNQNQGRVSFKLISGQEKKFVFENKEHDFPQRVIYQFITKDSLHAWVEGTEKGVEKRVDYYFRKQ
jgi:hypothetical protein